MSQRPASPLRAYGLDLIGFLLRALFAVLIGLVVGIVGVAFHHAIDLATEFRLTHPWLLFLLPAGGAVIVLLYHACGMGRDRGTNLVLEAVREHEPMRLRTAPLIFISTVLTHLVGGSAGREGAALQLGASISSKLAHKLGRHLDLADTEGRMMTACGMAAAFSALFGTPLTAALFALEVSHVGLFHYAALVPALLASLTAFLLAGSLGVPPTAYALSGLPALSPASVLQVAALGLLCALLAILFCAVMHAAGHLGTAAFPNPLLRALAGGVVLILLTFLFGGSQAQTFNGAGANLIAAALAGGQDIRPWTFLIKLLFTAVTLASGFRGGEIVPTFACGAAFGCVAGPLLGLDPAFGGAVGLVAAFCGVTNCPLSSILLAYELFGGGGLPLFALAIVVAYRLSGYSGLYSTQQIPYSKVTPVRHD